MIKLPGGEDLNKLLVDVRIQGSSIAPEKYLSAEIRKLAWREFVPQTLAINLLFAVRNSLTLTYGENKSIASAEGQGLLFNVLPKYLEVLVPDTAIAKEVMSEVRDKIRVFL